MALPPHLIWWRRWLTGSANIKAKAVRTLAAIGIHRRAITGLYTQSAIIEASPVSKAMIVRKTLIGVASCSF
jgi:hypothetical protein